ncbi:Alpha/beta-hydrolase [Favolaschia claudopus]|uniref:Carboxylic ester hydrolase n=1 Tax=Favolaschia claudopus TaxID=2862362 RepID=A0AAW0ALS2_9AGAR
MLLPFPSSLFLAISLSAILVSSTASSTPPVINTSSGTYVGLYDAANGTDVFKGIRYAAPPKRFTQAMPILKAPKETQSALEFGNDCAQAPPLVVAGVPYGPPIQGRNSTEDCLFLNIWRPSHVSNGTFTTEKSPVLVYIHGGGLSTGAGSEWDGTSLVRRSVATKKPIIYISINYRLGFLGFIGGAQVPATSSNVGYHDQRAALRWIQDNAASFGGDSSRVTISGESAGALSVHTHLFYPDSRRTFHGAIAASGGLLAGTTPDCTYNDRPGGAYDLLGNFTGCGTGKGSFECMQNMPFDKFWPLANKIYDVPNFHMWVPCKGGKGSLIDEFPINKFLRGDFLNLPVMTGTTRNEGNLLINTTFLELDPQPSVAVQNIYLSAVVSGQATNFHNVSQETIDKIVSLYADVPDKLSNSSLYNRAAQLVTDYAGLAPQRLFLESALAAKDSKRNLWAYEFDQEPPNLPSFLGAFHSVDLYYLNMGFPHIKEDDQLLTTFQDYWISFVNGGDPGKLWPRYSADNKKVLRLAEGKIGVQADTRQREQTDYFNQVDVLREFGRFGI